VDVCQVIKQRLQELGLEQRDLAAAAEVTESYISQLLNRKKAPPAADRTDLYEKMNGFLKLPKGQLATMVEAQRRQDLAKHLADPPAPLFREVRDLVIQKCHPERQGQVREIFEKQAFGELERLVTQNLLDVAKKVAREELKNDAWLRLVAKLRGRSYEEMRSIILEFLDTEVFSITVDQCSVFLAPLIDSWDIDLRTFGMEVGLNRRLTSTQLMKLQFVETQFNRDPDEEPGFKEFLSNKAMSADATEEELQFLKSLRFGNSRPSALYYYRELQSLRDPLHFRETSIAAMQKRRDAHDVERQMGLDTRKRAVRRWANHKTTAHKKRKSKLSRTRPRRPGRADLN
jgi:transcriptional regulator with XRE-family HTH domain